MTSARPVNQQHDLPLVLIHVGDDFPNEDARDSLLQSHIGRGSVPNGRQVLRQTHENMFVRYGLRMGLAVEPMQPILKLLDFPQGDVPSSLQLGRYQSLLGIYGVLSSSCQARFIASRFNFQFVGLSLLLRLPLHLLAAISST